MAAKEKILKKKNIKKTEKKPVNKAVKKEPVKEKPQTISKEYYFIVADGKELKDMLGLVRHMEHMTDDVFKHHVNDFKNDFANWIEHVFNEKPLADEIRDLKTREKIHIKLLSHMLESMLKEKR